MSRADEEVYVFGEGYKKYSELKRYDVWYDREQKRYRVFWGND